MKIGTREIGGNAPVYMIAEMSANHGGSLEQAKEIIHAAKESGADGIKLQTYTPDTMTIDCDNPYFQITDGTWKGETLYRLYQKAYTPWEWHGPLKEEAEGIGLDFFSTPFDHSSADFLEQLGTVCYKIASFELTDLRLLQYVAAKGKPVILSTGMAELAEIDEAVRAIRATGNNGLALLRCASAYPAVTDEMNLKTMQNMQEVFQAPVGLSDHSLGTAGAVAAVALGAKIIEKHFCLCRAAGGPDASFSMEPNEFADMVTQIRQAERAVGQICYGVSQQETENLKFRRSIFCVEDIKQGEILTENNIRVIRPGYGLAPKYYTQLLGQRALHDIVRGTPMKLTMAGLWEEPSGLEKRGAAECNRN